MKFWQFWDDYRGFMAFSKVEKIWRCRSLLHSFTKADTNYVKHIGTMLRWETGNTKRHELHHHCRNMVRYYWHHDTAETETTRRSHDRNKAISLVTWIYVSAIKYWHVIVAPILAQRRFRSFPKTTRTFDLYQGKSLYFALSRTSVLCTHTVEFFSIWKALFIGLFLAECGVSADCVVGG